jgi:hypothetical protein
VDAVLSKVNSLINSSIWDFDLSSDTCLCSKSKQSVDDWIGFDWVGGLTSWVAEYGNGHGVSGAILNND